MAAIGVRLFWALMALVGLFASTACAEERIALLVANAEYSSAVGELYNPHNDVAAIRASLIEARSSLTVLPQL